MLLTNEPPKIITKPEYKFQTSLFLPPNPERKDEGGLRTKGLFKHSYKLVNGVWNICDTESNPVKPAEEDIQIKIKEYTSKVSLETQNDKQIDSLPLITVITVVYNGEKYLEETIQSVINQTYPNVEYIIIDGGSTDRTIDIIKKYEDKIDYWVSEKDEGIYDAMNKGVTIALGEWVSFLGSDDSYLPRGVEEYFNYLYNFKNKLDYISSRINIIKHNKKIKGIEGEPWDWKRIQKYMCVAHVGSLHNRILFRNIGLFNTKYKIAGDYDLLLRAGKKLKAGYISSITANMLWYGISNTSIIETNKEAAEAKVNNTKRWKLIICLEMYTNFLKRLIVKFIKFISSS